MTQQEPPSFSLGGFKISLVGPWWFQITEVVAVLGFVVWSIVWICSDATRRGKNGFLAFIFLIAASWPFSLLFWLWLRPPLLPSEMPPLPATPQPVPPPIPSANP